MADEAEDPAPTTTEQPSIEQNNVSEDSEEGFGKDWQSLFVITVGNFVEWYDFGVVGVVAGELGANFFPESQANLVEGFFIFGIAFIVRPLGAYLFGSIADKFGRAFSLKLSIATMGVATFGFCICPTYHTVGYVGTVMLALCRVIQGLSVGGEGYTAVVYLYEKVDPNQKVWFLSLNSLSSLAGCIFGNFVVFVLQWTISKEGMESYGWRIPFVISCILIAFASLFRQRLTETDAFEEEEQIQNDQCLDTIEWPALGALVCMKCSDPFWTLTAWLPDFLYSDRNLTGANLAIVLVQIAAAMFLILGASVLDNMEWEKIMLACKVTSTVVFQPLFFYMLPAISNSFNLFWILLPYIVIEYAFTGLMDVYAMKLLPTVHTRATTMSLAHNFSGYVWGTLPFWSSLMVSRGASSQYVGVLLFGFAMIAITAVAAVFNFESKFTGKKAMSKKTIDPPTLLGS